MQQILACSSLAIHEDVIRKIGEEQAKIINSHYQPTSVVERFLQKLASNYLLRASASFPDWL